LPDPKIGKKSQIVFIPQKIANRLKQYINEKGIEPEQRISNIKYNAARVMVNKSGKMIGIHFHPHYLKCFAAIYTSWSGTPIKNVSKVILPHTHLSITQRYLGKVSDLKAMRWIENMYS
jgi:integrase